MNEINLNDDDVISTNPKENFINVNLSRFSQLEAGLGQRIGATAEKWIGEGVECELLRTDTPGWVKGKIRIRFEFIPDNLVPEDNPAADPS